MIINHSQSSTSKLWQKNCGIKANHAKIELKKWKWVFNQNSTLLMGYNDTPHSVIKL